MKKIAISLGVIECFVAFMALPAGLSLISQPDGSGIGISHEILDGSPFVDFFIPGIFLFVINGILQLLGAIFSFRKKSYAGVMGIILGILLMVWIIIQVYITNGIVHFLQPLFFVIGALEIILGFQFFSKNKILI